MVLFNYSTKEITAKIVYYGPGLCGKTTNLQFIYDSLPSNSKSRMLSLATKADRTLFFDFLPIELGRIRGMKTRMQLYTVPGQVYYNSTRQLVIKGADGLVFVVDSQRSMLDGNKESWTNLKENLRKQGIKAAEMPIVMQYNKRDLPDALPVEEIDAALNEYNAPFFESVATTGIGVEDTLKGISKLVLKHLIARYGVGSAEPFDEEIKIVTPGTEEDSDLWEMDPGRAAPAAIAVGPPKRVGDANDPEHGRVVAQLGEFDLSEGEVSDALEEAEVELLDDEPEAGESATTAGPYGLEPQEWGAPAAELPLIPLSSLADSVFEDEPADEDEIAEIKPMPHLVKRLDEQEISLFRKVQPEPLVPAPVHNQPGDVLGTAGSRSVWDEPFPDSQEAPIAAPPAPPAAVPAGLDLPAGAEIPLPAGSFQDALHSRGNALISQSREGLSEIPSELSLTPSLVRKITVPITITREELKLYTKLKLEVELEINITD